MRSGFTLLKEDIRHYYKGVLLAGIYIAVLAGILGIPVCPMVYVTGLPCPGCGITRAALLFLQGDFSGAYRMHPFFYILLAALLLAAVLRYICLKNISWMKYLVVAIAAAAIVFYVYRMWRYFPDTVPMVYYDRSILMIVWQKIFN